MAKSLTQTSPKASRKQHADASHLSRKDGVYYYRRLLPSHLGTDVALSLGTRNYREAEHLAAALDISFRHAVQTVKSTDDLRSVLRTYIEDILAEDTRMRFAIPVGRAVYGLGAEPPPGRDPAAMDRDTIALALEDARRALAARDFPSVEETVQHLMKDHGLPESARNALAYGVLEAHVKIFEEQQRRTLGKSPLVLLDDPPVAAAPLAPTAAAGPRFSKALPPYIDLAVKDKGWRGQSKSQNEATFAMFQEVCGDLPVTAYTRSHLSDFYNVLRGLPALYSKDKRWRALPLREVVEKAKDDAAPRLTMKTIKRHFSALGGFFSYAKRHGMIQGENPAYGFEFPSKGRSNSKRMMWEGEKLQKLFQSPVWTGCHPHFRARPGEKVIRDEKYWLPLLGLYHGNRLEEFAQLRREDVKREGDIWYFDIHGADGRQIKNDQSARRVPIHPEIERLGFLEYVKETAPKPSDLVFPDLKPGGPDNKVGYYFSKWWTNYRKAIGVYERWLDYHSFRHGVTTKLYAADVSPVIVDELTGHEGEGTSQRVYLKELPLSVLKDAIAKVSWPELASM